MVEALMEIHTVANLAWKRIQLEEDLNNSVAAAEPVETKPVVEEPKLAEQARLPDNDELTAQEQIAEVPTPVDVPEVKAEPVKVAEKKAQANSIMRREESAATRSLLNTAK